MLSVTTEEWFDYCGVFYVKSNFCKIKLSPRTADFKQYKTFIFWHILCTNSVRRIPLWWILGSRNKDMLRWVISDIFITLTKLIVHIIELSLTFPQKSDLYYLELKTIFSYYILLWTIISICAIKWKTICVYIKKMSVPLTTVVAVRIFIHSFIKVKNIRGYLS